MCLNPDPESFIIYIDVEIVSDCIEHVSSCPKSLLRWHNNTLVPVGNQVSMELA